ncbi:CYTH and CHAD domain-containing protein [Pseudoduganella aquatica]|uniref:CHAD domain-containing protein n=1 Tax=Pseudoduganella aquatica TaxID=2660641 RepID=A0A7X4HA72_9BURK|nr:CYTH and CHAD domain-containing protein [Pseudoduganella aquatica]MYN07503.1 CHAD domain-containing protein [Pseudoduganella aquatica]
METELKLTLRPADSERMRSHAILAAHATAGPTEHEHTDIYYDTPEHQLWEHGATLRVRSAGGTFIQTVKTVDNHATALHRRGEWECELPDGKIQPALLARQIKDAKLAQLLSSPEIQQRLQPMFSGVTRRTTWQLRLPGGEEVECAIDAGDFRGGEHHANISELELELKDGAPDKLFDFALALHREIPLELANDSKAARGYALLGSTGPSAVKAKPVKLAKKIVTEEALRRISVNCVEQMEANISGVLAKDVESLHQMRVGLRRLRALLDMFEPLIPAPPDISEGLDWLAGELGATRDWDVLASATLDRIDGAEMRALRDSSRAKAAKLHGAMAQTLHAPRFTELMLRLNSWIRGHEWRAQATPTGRTAMDKCAIRSAMPLLRKAERRLRKRIAGLDPQDPPALHRVRIAAKKARYGAEFFRDLLDKKNTARYISRLSALQDRLGLLNDLAVAARLLPELQHGHGQLAHEAAYAHGYLTAQARHGIDQLGPPLKAVAGLRMAE